MDKTPLILAIILVLGGLTVAEPVKAPVSGGGIQDIYKALDKNTKSLDKSVERIVDLEKRLEENNTRWIGLNIFGISVFMIAMYSFIQFIEHIRKRKNKKKHEEYISELESKIKHERQHFLTVQKRQTTMLVNQQKQIQELIDKLPEITVIKDKPGWKQKYTLFINLIILCVGFLLGTYIGGF